MVDPKTRQKLEWKLEDLAFEFQEVDVEDAAELLRMAWKFETKPQEQPFRGDLKNTG